MKTKNMILSLLMAAMSVVAGCSGGGDDEPIPPDTPSTSYTLSMSVSALSFEQSGGQQSVTVTTNAPTWSAESSQSWCRVSQRGNTLTVTADANNGAEQRTATITVKAANVIQTITVTQSNASGLYCRTNIPGEYVFTCENTGISWVMETNIDNFEAASSESWCKAEVAPIPNSNNKKLMIEVESYKTKNEQGAYGLPRIATVQLTGGTVFSHTVTVVQNSLVHFTIRTFLYPFVDGCLEMSPEGDTKEVMIENNCYSWTPKTDADWLTVKRIDSFTLSITSTARAANDNTRRQAQVYIEDDSDPYNYKATITVRDADSGIQGEDYNYDNHTDWD